MSVERCLQVIESRFDRDEDPETLFEELAEIEAEALEGGRPEKFHAPLSSFLERVDELFAEEELNENLLIAAIANLRTDLERIKASQVPEDPLEHLFLDMMRYECGTVPSSTTLTTLGRYETLLLALRDQFEHSTDPTDEGEIAVMMRNGLEILEDAGKRLRQDLENELDNSFDEIRQQFNEGTEILLEFRRKAVFVNKDGDSE